MQAHADVGIALKNWSPTPRSPLKVNATIDDADLGDVAALLNVLFAFEYALPESRRILRHASG